MSSERGGDFTAVLFNLWEAGYDLEWQCVNSKDFGVPQHRERVYLVGYLGGIRGRKVFPVSGANTAVVKKVIGGYQGERVYDADGLSVTLTADGGGAGGKTGLYLCGTKKPEEWMECLKENGNEAAAKPAPVVEAKPKKEKPKGGTKESEKLVRRLEREIEKQEAAIAELDAKIEAAAADYQELTRLLGEKETAENDLMALMEQWEAAQSDLSD